MGCVHELYVAITDRLTSPTMSAVYNRRHWCLARVAYVQVAVALLASWSSWPCLALSCVFHEFPNLGCGSSSNQGSCILLKICAGIRRKSSHMPSPKATLTSPVGGGVGTHPPPTGGPSGFFIWQNREQVTGNHNTTYYVPDWEANQGFWPE